MSLSLTITRNACIPLRLRKKLGNLMNVPTGRDFTADVFGMKYSGRTDTHLDRKIYQYGLHEPATIRLLRDLLKSCREEGRRPVYVDIGTNTGLHLLAVAAAADEAHGFEPWENVRSCAERNIQGNSLGHVHLHPFGLSDRDAMLPFRAPDGNNFGVGAFLEQGAPSNLSLEVRAGDKFFAENNIRPSVIKIDVEGHEKSVLLGLRETIQKHRPFVVFEYGSVSRKDLQDGTFLQSLFGPGYHYYGIRRSREMPSLAPFNPSKKWENILASPVKL